MILSRARVCKIGNKHGSPERMTTTSVHRRLLSHGLTIVEILIVVIVLGIVAFAVVPRFSKAAGDAEDIQLKNHLEVVRRQIELYRIEHGGQYPTATTEEEFLEQMLQRNESDGSAANVPSTNSDHGPYLPDIPINPYTGGKRITCGGHPGEVAGDWHYDPVTGHFRANRPAEKVHY